jgi:hypothetical protein
MLVGGIEGFVNYSCIYLPPPFSAVQEQCWCLVWFGLVSFLPFFTNHLAERGSERDEG